MTTGLLARPPTERLRDHETLIRQLQGGGLRFFNIKAFGAKVDGVTNDYAAIIAARDAAAANGGGIVYFPPGTTVSQGTLEPVSNVYFLGAGRGVSILKAGGANNVFQLYTTGVSNVGISDLTLQGNLAYGGYGLNFSEGPTDSFFERLEVKDLNTAGIILGNGARRCYFEDIYVHNINGVTGPGIWLFHDVQDCFLHNIHTYDTGGAGVVLDAGTNDALGVVVKNVHLSNILVNLCCQEHPASGGIMFEGAQHCTLTNFLIKDSGGGTASHGLYLNRDQADIGSDHNAFSNGVIKDTQDTPIRVAASSDNAFSNIDIEDVATGGSNQYPVYLLHQGWTTDAVTDNLFTGIKARGGSGAITAGVRFGDGAGNLSRNYFVGCDFASGTPYSVHGSATAPFTGSNANWVNVISQGESISSGALQGTTLRATTDAQVDRLFPATASRGYLQVGFGATAGNAIAAGRGELWDRVAISSGHSFGSFPDPGAGGAYVEGQVEIDGNLNHDGTGVGFYGTAPVTKQTGVAVTAAGVHAALVNLGLIAA